MGGEAELAQELQALEEELLSPATRRNAGRLRTLLAENFEEVGSSGRVFGREAIVDLLAAEVGENVVRTLSNFSVRPLGPTLVQVRYQSRALSSGSLRAAERCSIWERRPDGWQMLFHQGTTCSPTESRVP